MRISQKSPKSEQSFFQSFPGVLRAANEVGTDSVVGEKILPPAEHSVGIVRETISHCMQVAALRRALHEVHARVTKDDWSFLHKY